MTLNIIIVFPAVIFTAIWFYLAKRTKSKNLARVTSIVQSSNFNTDLLYCKHCNGVFRINDPKVTPIKDAARMLGLNPASP